MNSATLFAKGKHHLNGANDLLDGKTAETITAADLDSLATLLLVSTRLFLRLAGRIDVPRPETILLPPKKPRPKPLVPVSKKTPEQSARSPKPKADDRDYVFNVRMTMDEGNDELGKDKPKKKKKKPVTEYKHTKPMPIKPLKSKRR